MRKEQETKNILFLDGIRGIFAFVVLWYHYLSAIYPEFINGSGPGKKDRFLVSLGQSPLNIFFDGNLAVAVFFVMSGFVLSYAYFKTGEEEAVRKNIIKRFWRLELPVFASVFFSGLIMKAGLFYNHEAATITGSKWLNKFYSFEFSWEKMIKQALYANVTLGKFSYNHTLWTIRYEFWGVFLVAVLLFLLKKKNGKQRACIYAFLCLLFFNRNGSAYLAYILGVLMCDITVHIRKIPKWVLMPFLILGIYLCSYPAEMKGDKIPLYELLSRPDIHKLPMFWHILGAFLVLLPVFYLKPLQRFFSFRPFRAMGKISYSFYVIGFVVQNSLFCYCFVKWYPMFGRFYAMLCAAAVSIPFTIAVSLIVYDTFEKWGKMLADFVYKKFRQLEN